MSESIMDQIVETPAMSGNAKILVVGVGGGGCNAVQNMIESGLSGVDFICANTDLQALNKNPAQTHIQLGEKLTRGLGAGSNPSVGEQAAEESKQAIEEALTGAEMVFITAGMGGGTGTGAAPVVAEVAKACGALAVAVVTRPFTFEGQRRANYAKAGIEELSKHVDCLITIPNDRIMTFAPKKTPLKELMRKANDVLYYGVKGISDVITQPGYLNVDFADVRTAMAESGLALMGMGSGKGENRAEEAVRSAITSPLLEDVSLSSAKAILYNITASDDISGEEMELIGEKIRSEVPEEANIKFGILFDEKLEDEIRVTVVATGIEPSVTPEVKPSYERPTQRVVRPQPSVRPSQPAAQAGSYQPEPQPTYYQPASQPMGNRVDFSDVQQAQGFQQDARKARSQFVRDAQERWKTESRHGDHDGMNAHRPGELDFQYEDDLSMPTFIRKQMD